MKIVVLVKYVPNRGGDPPEIDGNEFRLRREQPEAGLDPADEPGVEAGVRIVERDGGEVTVVSMGPPSAEAAVVRALAMGADKGVLVSDDQLRGADVLATARVLAAALRRDRFDLVIAGSESTDSATGTLPMSVAALLGVTSVTFARRLELVETGLSIERQTPDGHDLIQCPLPALITVTGAVAAPRYPSLRDTIKAKSKPLERLSLSDLGLGPDDVALNHRIESIELAPEREAGDIIEDVEVGIARLLDLLREAKVL
ncbi:MAG: electron transfer flavoprotein subunit beta/FixA family protein [Acidimicrobiales bacterium]